MNKILLGLIFLSAFTFAQPYPDQFYSNEEEDLMLLLESLTGTQIMPDGKSIKLSDGITDGVVVFKPDSSEHPFNRGLPSWNGHVFNDGSGFKVQMRFFKTTWSPWLTIGYWKKNVWSSYGSTSYSGGEIDIDYVVLNSYHTKWQFQVLMKRNSTSLSSPTLHKLSFFVSDQQTTNNVNIQSIVNDNPEEIFIPTQHYYQYSLDPGIGGDICSPTSVCMVLRSYDIAVDPLQFARDNYDTYWGMFGIWPRAVQNAAEKNLNGAVTRYRTWSEAREVLNEGGRIVMSVGPPLYAGHLMMLAGFDSLGNPLVHDPAKSNGYAYKYNKTSVSQSWFNKGGIAYTFFPGEAVTSVESNAPQLAHDYQLSVYPNPFNPQTTINFETSVRAETKIIVYDVTGKEVAKIYNDVMEPGSYNFRWNASNFPSGMYFIQTISGDYNKTVKAVLVK
jgi:hypothetical protein